jgi:transposase-like protein
MVKVLRRGYTTEFKEEAVRLVEAARVGPISVA